MKIPQQEIENQLNIERRKPEYDHINFYDDGANGAFDDGFEHGFKAAVEWIGLEIDETKEEPKKNHRGPLAVIGDAVAAGLMPSIIVNQNAAGLAGLIPGKESYDAIVDKYDLKHLRQITDAISQITHDYELKPREAMERIRLILFSGV